VKIWVAFVLLTIVMACFGCGEPTGKNTNRDKDKPTPPEAIKPK
jgi:hypothetical protein